MNESVIQMRAFHEEFRKISQDLGGEVRKDVASKYPELLKGKEKDSNMNAGSYGPNSSMQGLPGVIDNKPKMAGLLQRLTSEAGTHKAELAGLGILAAPSVDQMQAAARSRLAGEGSAGAKKRQVMGPTAHSLAEIGGLGVLAGPSAAHLLTHR